MTFYSCTAVDANIASWGPCIQDTVFFGDPIIFAIFIFGMIGLIMWKGRLPMGLVFPVGFLLSLAIYTANNQNSGFLIIVLLSAIGSFAWFAYVIWNRWRG